MERGKKERKKQKRLQREREKLEMICFRVSGAGEMDCYGRLALRYKALSGDCAK